MKKSKDKAIEQMIDKVLEGETAGFMNADDPRYKYMMDFYDKYGHMPPTARRVHILPPEGALRPRGTLQKNSLSAEILQKLQDAHTTYTDPEFSDSLENDAVIGVLEQNLEEEVRAALQAYKEWATH